MRKKLKLTVQFLVATTLSVNVADLFFPHSFCHIDPTCRRMTNDEKQIANDVFGKYFNSDAVRIYERPMFLHSILNLVKGNLVAASAHENVIFFTTLPFINRAILELAKKHKTADDPTYDGIANRGLLVHELTHIAQHQFNIPHNDKEDGYEYVLSNGKAFGEYGAEQQAEIVKDFFLNTYPYIQRLNHRTDSKETKAICSLIEQRAALFKPHFYSAPENCVTSPK